MFNINIALLLCLISCSISASEYSFTFTLSSRYPGPVLTITEIGNDGKIHRAIPKKKDWIKLFALDPKIKKLFFHKFGDRGLIVLNSLTSTSAIHKADFDLLGIVDAFPNASSVNAINNSFHCQPDQVGLDEATTTPWDEPPQPPLIVEAGPPRKIFPGSILHYSSITIEAGGILEITNGPKRFTYLKSSGNCNISGTIKVRQFQSSVGNFEETAPDGANLRVILPSTNRGGDGGNGGDGFHGGCLGLPRIIGGSADRGTTVAGGGGGAGSRMDKVGNSCVNHPGGNAQGDLGGRGSFPNSDGGRGGERPVKGNGGYLYLKCVGDINIDGATFDFRGENGVPGENGNLNGGGGGGGGPGGHGGVLYINKPPSNAGNFSDKFEGGSGGSGGIGGKIKSSSGDDSLGRPPGPGPDNGPGGDGRSGYGGVDGSFSLIPTPD